MRCTGLLTYSNVNPYRSLLDPFSKRYKSLLKNSYILWCDSAVVLPYIHVTGFMPPIPDIVGVLQKCTGLPRMRGMIKLRCPGNGDGLPPTVHLSVYVKQLCCFEFQEAFFMLCACCHQWCFKRQVLVAGLGKSKQICDKKLNYVVYYKCQATQQTAVRKQIITEIFFFAYKSESECSW